MSCDVLVTGGGAAGLAAAVAAARAGARVVMLERYGFLGGMATAGMVGTVCGLYLRNAQGERADCVSGGFVREWCERLARAASSEPVKLADGLRVLPYASWAFERLADELVRETRGIELLLHATLTDATARDGRLTEAHALVWNRQVIVRPQAVVDCTGEATAIHLSGGDTEEGVADQAPAILFAMENVDPAFSDKAAQEMMRSIARSIDEGHLSSDCGRVSVVPGTGHSGRVLLRLGLPNSADWAAVNNRMTSWEQSGRGLIDELQRFLIEHVPPFRHARLSRAATQVGVRMGRRISGQAHLLDTDVLACRKHADGIARGCWPIEDWNDSPKPSMTLFEENDFYEIPLGCLRTQGLHNVFAAGRCLAADPRALSSARVIGTALGTGWAAGTAAACTVEGHPLDEAVARVREQLASHD